MSPHRQWMVAAFFSVCAGVAFIGNLVYPHIKLKQTELGTGTYIFIPEHMPDLVCVYFVNQNKGTCLKRGLENDGQDLSRQSHEGI